LIKETNTLIVGASVSGLASAACLETAGIDYIVIEKHTAAVTPWRNHYERLHLHTNKMLSGLPYKKFPSQNPLYPSRLQVLEYMESYQKDFNIKPLFNTEALSISRRQEGGKEEGGKMEGGMEGRWITETTNGTIISKNVVMATGAYGLPRNIEIKGMESFPGKILHSSSYKTGRDFKDQEVLVIGFGNSACEIALDLYEQGAFPSMSVRSAVNILPRDILGIPVLQLALLMDLFPPRVADKINAPLIRLLVGNISKLGLRKLPYGPMEQIQKEQSVPLLDIGTVKLIREGRCTVYDEIDHIEGRTICFKNGRRKEFDAIVAAIGYGKGYEQDLLKVDKSRFEDLNVKSEKQKFFGKEGLYFCGFYISPTGQFREIGLDAKRIAKAIARRN
jgi:cation diffusion facilitator CzcD-associated flavoprotein CzcO